MYSDMILQKEQDNQTTLAKQIEQSYFDDKFHSLCKKLPNDFLPPFNLMHKKLSVHWDDPKSANQSKLYNRSITSENINISGAGGITKPHSSIQSKINADLKPMKQMSLIQTPEVFSPLKGKGQQMMKQKRKSMSPIHA